MSERAPFPVEGRENGGDLFVSARRHAGGVRAHTEESERCEPDWGGPLPRTGILRHRGTLRRPDRRRGPPPRGVRGLCPRRLSLPFLQGLSGAGVHGMAHPLSELRGAARGNYGSQGLITRLVTEPRVRKVYLPVPRVPRPSEGDGRSVSSPACVRDAARSTGTRR